jgi:hypothetical protein
MCPLNSQRPSDDAIINLFSPDLLTMDEADFEFVDDLIDTEIFGSLVHEELDPETKKLLENF